MAIHEALPTPTYFTNDVPSIVQWRKQYGPLITYFEQARSGHKIVGKSRATPCETANLEQKCQTRIDRWNVRAIPDMNILGTNAPQLPQQEINDIAEYLTVNQQLYEPKGAEKEHAEAVGFLARNWERLRLELYPVRPFGNVPPYNFSEVLVDSKTMERADFVGFGPDGRLFVFEFKRKDRISTQAERFAKKIRDSLSDFNIPISPFMAWYKKGGHNVLHLQIPEKIMMSGGSQMEFFIKYRKFNVYGSGPTSSYHEFDQFAINFKEELQRAG